MEIGKSASAGDTEMDFHREIFRVIVSTISRLKEICLEGQMGFFDSLKSTFSTGKLKKEQIERLREIIWAAISDGQISDQELAYINDFFATSDLSREDFDKVRTEVFTHVVHQAISDRRVTQSELGMLTHLMQRLEIPPNVQSWAHQQVQYYSIFAMIESGGPLPVGQASGLIMQKGEVCHASLPAQLIEERVVSRNYVGGSQGVNLRLMKGVSYRVGQQKGELVSQSGLVPISSGYFVITNQRLAFSGDRKSVTAPFSKLLDLHIFSNGLNFSVAGKVRPVIVQFSLNEEAELCGLIISRIINEL